MKVLYKAETWLDFTVTKIEAVKETDKSVWFIARNVELRELKETNNHAYYADKEDAERHVRNFLLKEIERAESRVKHWREKLDKFNRAE